jgi:hypothetical protein
LIVTTSSETTEGKAPQQKREPRKKRQEGAASEATEEKIAPAKTEKSRGRELVYKPKTAPSGETAAEAKPPVEVEEKKERLRSKSKPKREQPQLVYKRKDEITPEEKAAAVKISDQAKAEDGAENKGERRRRDGGSRKDAKDIPRYKSRARGAAEGDEEEQEEPKFTSSYDEYRAGFWRRPKKTKIRVTHETELPAPPKPLLEHPDEPVYHKSMADLDEKIDVLIKKSVSITTKSY